MWYERTEALIGADKIERLKKVHIAIFGIGGVGSYIFEALVRAGIGNITMVDGDMVCETNLNRQIIATCDKIGEAKVNVAKERALKINPSVNINTFFDFYREGNREKFFNARYDYVADAIDSVNDKTDLIKICKEKDIKIISSMGTANKLEPSKLEITDIYKTSVCPLAKVMRKKLKDSGIKALKVVYSKEEPCVSRNDDIKLGSISFVPSVAGLMMASEIVRDIISD